MPEPFMRSTSCALLASCVHSVAAPVAVPACTEPEPPIVRATAAKPANHLFEQRCGIVNSSRFKPVDRPFVAMFGFQCADALKVLFARRADKAQRDWPKRHVEEPPAFWRGDVVFA